MPTLPRGVLTVFPVQYPPIAWAAGLGALETNGRTRPEGSTRGHESRAIGFGPQSFGQDRPGSHAHRATDIFAGFGCEVRASCDGHVVKQFYATDGAVPGSGFMPRSASNRITSGNYVMIRDARGYHHLYGHMFRRPSVQPGQFVRAGTLIGTVGATGLPPGRVQHLHYQVTRRTDEGRAIRGEYYNAYDELRRLAEVLGCTVSPGSYVQLRL